MTENLTYLKSTFDIQTATDLVTIVLDFIIVFLVFPYPFTRNFFFLSDPRKVKNFTLNFRSPQSS